MEAIGLAGTFPVVEAGSAAGAVKPAAMRRVLAAWGFRPGEVAGVGDSPSDVRAARQVGLVSVAAAWAPGADRDRLAASQPDCLFDAVPPLASWLAGR